ncbi:acetate kinase [soil metagenome]
MHVLVVNCGSSSLKFDLIDTQTEEAVARGLVERIGAVSSLARFGVGEEKPERESLQAPSHTEALDFLMRKLREAPQLAAVKIEAVGHRVVHGGERFDDSASITEEVLDAIRDAFDLAPLHNPANLKGIEAARKAFPDLPQVAVFDTAFHQTLPPTSYLYAIPNRFYRRHKIRRYGFHGTSHYFVSRRLYNIGGIDKSNSRVITCHLGNGCSIAAIRNGRSIDTSMGMTPLSGLVMGTRSGDLDPSIVFDLIEKEEMTLAEVHTLLNRYSGLLGLSGYAADMRDLMREAADGDDRCRQAIDVFCHRIRGYIGQYMAALNGCDAIVFTAGIGENAPEIRAQCLQDLDGLGIEIDPALNEQAVGKEMPISTDKSAVSVWVIPTNEELVIAKDAEKISVAARQSPYV